MSSNKKFEDTEAGKKQASLFKKDAIWKEISSGVKTSHFLWIILFFIKFIRKFTK